MNDVASSRRVAWDDIEELRHPATRISWAELGEDVGPLWPGGVLSPTTWARTWRYHPDGFGDISVYPQEEL